MHWAPLTLRTYNDNADVIGLQETKAEGAGLVMIVKLWWAIELRRNLLTNREDIDNGYTCGAQPGNYGVEVLRKFEIRIVFRLDPMAIRDFKDDTT